MEILLKHFARKVEYVSIDCKTHRRWSEWKLAVSNCIKELIDEVDYKGKKNDIPVKPIPNRISASDLANFTYWLYYEIIPYAPLIEVEILFASFI